MSEISVFPFSAIAAARKRGEIAEMAREPARVGLADMTDAEREQKAVEGDGPPRLDRGEQVARRGRAKAVPFLELRRAYRRRAQRG